MILPSTAKPKVPLKARTKTPPQPQVAPLIVAALIVVVAVLATACSTSEGPTLAADIRLEPTAVFEVDTPVAAATPSPEPTTAEPTVVPSPTPEPDPLRCLNTRQRLGQTLMPLVTQSELTEAASLAKEGDIGGLTILGTSTEMLAADLAELQSQALVPLHIGSDEEGGTVQRLSGLLGVLPSAQEMAAMDPAAVQQQMRDYAQAMRGLGVTVAFAPVIDVGGGPGIGSRSFSDDPEVVEIYGAAVSAGLIEGGVMPVLKHFPGHGRASADSHDSLPTTPSLDELWERDLLPFESLLPGAPAVMIAHLSVPGLSDETPTSLSPRTINGLLRTELGYDGLVITDALNMGAITGLTSVNDAALRSISAGADVAMINGLSDVGPVLDYLVQAIDAGILNENRVNEAVGRVLASKGELAFCGG